MAFATNNPQRRYEYKIFRDGVFLGKWPKPKTDFHLNQDINSAGGPVVIELKQTPDERAVLQAPATEAFTAAGTWTCPEGVTSVMIMAWGAGGGGGGGLSAPTIPGAGGGGGGFSAGVVDVVPGEEYEIAVGAGGAAGTNDLDNATAGGDTYFGGHLTLLAKGGGKGAPTVSPGGTGGQASAGVGQVKFSGGNGGTAASNPSSRGGGGGGGAGDATNGTVGQTGIVGSGGAGGAGGSTGGGAGGAGGNNSVGLPGNTIGGGGGGKSGAGANGGAGARGELRIIYASAPTVLSPLLEENLDVEIWEYYGSYGYLLNETGGRMLAEDGSFLVAQLGAPDGHKVFTGYILDVEAEIEGPDDDIAVTLSPHSSEFSNTVIEAGEGVILDPVTATTDQGLGAGDLSGAFGPHAVVQSLLTPAEETKITAIGVLLRGIDVGQAFSVNVYLYTGSTPLGARTLIASWNQVIAVEDDLRWYKFGLTSPYIAAASEAMNIEVVTVGFTINSSPPIRWGETATDTYPDGQQFTLIRGGTYTAQNEDMAFRLYGPGGVTKYEYPGGDQGLIMKDVMDDYNAQGGVVTYDDTSIDLTGTSAPYAFNVNTTLEGIQDLKNIAPSGWYWYVDLALNILHFHKIGTRPAHMFVKGRHIKRFRYRRSLLNLVNRIYYTGGVVDGLNLFGKYTDAAGKNTIGNLRPGLARINDPRVLDRNTLDALGQALADSATGAIVLGTLEIINEMYDPMFIRHGQVVGVRGYGTVVDSARLQIVSIDRKPDITTLKLGFIPPRQSKQIEILKANVVQLQVLSNPLAPS